MSYTKMRTLIEQLHRRTQEGTLSWLETEREGIYQAAFPNYSVRLSEKPPKEPQTGGMDYWVSIYNVEGKLIDEVSDPDMRDDFEEIQINAYRLMRDLYEEARRSAMGVQEALSEILGQLER